MDLPALTYLTFDSAVRGIGASQVTPYVERLAQRGMEVHLHSFEEGPPPDRARGRLGEVRWHPHDFGPRGAMGGVARVARAAWAVRHAALVHASSDLPAAATMLAGRPAWVWDVRAFWADQRIALGMLRAGSATDRVLRRVEAAAARRSTAILTATGAAIPVLAERHGEAVAGKARIVHNCVDLVRFPLALPMPEADPVQVLFSGSFNQLYDVPTMVRLVERLRARRAVRVSVFTPAGTDPPPGLQALGDTFGSVHIDAVADVVAEHHLGFAVCRRDHDLAVRGAAPAKLAEFLACGRPVVLNRGLGDMDELVRLWECGVVIEDTSDPGLEAAADDVERLLADPETPSRCRDLAERHFDLEGAVDQLIATYGDVVAAAARRP